MTDTKHTPGPWAVHPNQAVVDAFDGGVPLSVCALLWPTDERSEDETFANARLIASAPDLLDALREIADLPWFRQDEGAQIARAAIAKAKGETT